MDESGCGFLACWMHTKRGRDATMKIVIVGGGAIGRLFGSFLAKGGNEISLIDVDQEVVGAMQSGG
ncbi:MAG: hypothetical protein EHM86_09095, partial [Desulfobulbaceae bacterium]